MGEDDPSFGGAIRDMYRPVCHNSPATQLFGDDFESGLGAWTLSNEGVNPEYVPRDWVLDTDLPDGRPGPEAFFYNTYNLVLETILMFPPNGNPLAGEWAWSGADGGRVSGSWGRSMMSTPGALQAGDKIRFRFALGVDGCNGLDGWYVDQVMVYTCDTAPVGGPPPDMGTTRKQPRRARR